MVGHEQFDEFLFKYVQHFKGQLVASEVSRFCRFIPYGSHLTREQLINFGKPRQTVKVKFDTKQVEQFWNECCKTKTKLISYQIDHTDSLKP